MTSLLSVVDVAQRIKCSRDHVYDLIASGDLRVVDVAGPGSTRSKTRIREDDLAAFIDARTRAIGRRTA